MSTEDKSQGKSDGEIKNKETEEAVPKAKASGLGGLVPAGGKIKKSAAKQVAKII